MVQQRYFNFDGEQPQHDAPPLVEGSFVTGPEAERPGIRHISHPLDAIMKNINIRVLVNGIGEEVKENALHDLAQAGVSTEVIETELNRLAALNSRNFSPAKVRRTIAWVFKQWSTAKEEM